MKYLILLAYDGTEYQGWQEQPHKHTIANILSDTFYKVFNMPAKLYGASRTDSGVHALGQVAEVQTDLSIDPSDLKRAWNGRLPKTIHIRKAIIAPSHFNPRLDVTQKTYYYHFFTQRALPGFAPFGIVYTKPFDVDKLQSALNLFQGKHNFRSFCTGDEKKDTVRIINMIKLIYLKNVKTYRIVIQGPGFLRYMIRRIVGAALECSARKDLPLSHLFDTLAACNPEHTLPTAPASGLLLRKIEYKKMHW